MCGPKYCSMNITQEIRQYAQQNAALAAAVAEVELGGAKAVIDGEEVADPQASGCLVASGCGQLQHCPCHLSNIISVYAVHSSPLRTMCRTLTKYQQGKAAT